jgi:hypothetical protein
MKTFKQAHVLLHQCAKLTQWVSNTLKERHGLFIKGKTLSQAKPCEISTNIDIFLTIVKTLKL